MGIGIVAALVPRGEPTEIDRNAFTSPTLPVELPAADTDEEPALGFTVSRRRAS